MVVPLLFLQSGEEGAGASVVHVFIVADGLKEEVSDEVRSYVGVRGIDVGSEDG